MADLIARRLYIANCPAASAVLSQPGRPGKILRIILAYNALRLGSAAWKYSNAGRAFFTYWMMALITMPNTSAADPVPSMPCLATGYPPFMSCVICSKLTNLLLLYTSSESKKSYGLISSGPIYGSRKSNWYRTPLLAVKLNLIMSGSLVSHCEVALLALVSNTSVISALMAVSNILTTVLASLGFFCVLGYRLMTNAMRRRSSNSGHAVRISVADCMPGPNVTVGKYAM